MLKVYIEKINEIKGIRYLCPHRERMWGEKGAETERDRVTHTERDGDRSKKGHSFP